MLLGDADTALKPFRAVLRYETFPPSEIAVLASSDFDALCRAQRFMGSAQSFTLYEGHRLVANYRPAPGLAALLGAAPGAAIVHTKP